MGSHGTRRAPARATATARDPDVQAVLDAVRRIVRALRVSARTTEKRLGISAAQLFVLHSLAEAPADSINDLAERTMTDQSSVSVVVRRLVERGLVTRARDEADARRVQIELSSSGRALIRRAPEAAPVRLIGALCQLPRARRHALARDLTSLVQAMGEGTGPAPMLFEDDRRSPRNRSRG